jgi:hypothetical protein
LTPVTFPAYLATSIVAGRSLTSEEDLPMRDEDDRGIERRPVASARDGAMARSRALEFMKVLKRRGRTADVAVTFDAKGKAEIADARGTAAERARWEARGAASRRTVADLEAHMQCRQQKLGLRSPLTVAELEAHMQRRLRQQTLGRPPLTVTEALRRTTRHAV